MVGAYLHCSGLVGERFHYSIFSFGGASPVTNFLGKLKNRDIFKALDCFRTLDCFGVLWIALGIQNFGVPSLLFFWKSRALKF